jgi:hypothetical protein
MEKSLSYEKPVSPREDLKAQKDRDKDSEYPNSIISLYADFDRVSEREIFLKSLTVLFNLSAEIHLEIEKERKYFFLIDQAMDSKYLSMSLQAVKTLLTPDSQEGPLLKNSEVFVYNIDDGIRNSYYERVSGIQGVRPFLQQLEEIEKSGPSEYSSLHSAADIICNMSS